MSLVAIRAKIKTKLEARVSVDDSQPLVAVYQEHRTDLEGFPSVTFEPSDVISDYETNTQNTRKYVFRVVIHQEMEKIGRGKALDILAGIVDTLMDDFDKDDTLGGSANLGVRAVPTVWGVYDEGTGKVMYCELKIEAQNCVSII